MSRSHRRQGCFVTSSYRLNWLNHAGYRRVFLQAVRLRNVCLNFGMFLVFEGVLLIAPQRGANRAPSASRAALKGSHGRGLRPQSPVGLAAPPLSFGSGSPLLCLARRKGKNF